MKYVLDARRMRTKEEMHTYLKEALDLPEYYGKNLDALFDCLREMNGAEIEIENLTMDNVCAQVCKKLMREAGIKVV